MSDLGRRHLAERPVRSGLVGVSIALGVAVLLGVAAGGTTIRAGLHGLTDTLSSRADVAIEPTGPLGSQLPASLAGRLGKVDGVRRVASIRASGASPTPVDRLVKGWNAVAMAIPAEDRDVAGVTTETGRLPARDDELAVERHSAEDLGVAVGDQLRFDGPDGSAVTATVVGYLEQSALTNGSAGDVLLGLPAFADRIGMPHAPSEVLVQLDQGVRTSAWIASHRAELGDVRLEDVTTLRGPMEDLFEGVIGALGALSALALILAGYLIHLALSSSVAQRTRTYGTLLALGSTSRQIASTVIAEVAWLALLSVTVGVGLGLAIARGLASAMAGIFDTADHGLVVHPIDIVFCAGAGLVIAGISSLIPARHAVRSAPIAAIRGEAPAFASSPWTTVGGGLCIVVAGVLVVRGTGIVGTAGTGLMMLGVGFVLPALLPRLGALLSPLVRRVSPGMGEVAVAHMVKERSRSALTAGLLVGVLGVTLLAGTAYRTLEPAFERYMQVQYGADLLVDAGLGLGASAMPADQAARVRALPGVRAATPVWYASTEVEGLEDDAALVVVEPASYFDASGFLFVSGDAERARRSLDHGGVLLPSLVAKHHGWHLGSSIDLRVGGRSGTYRVAGTYSSFGDATSRGVVIGKDDAGHLLGGPLAGPNELRVDLRPGFSQAEVGSQLRDATALPLRIRYGDLNVKDALRQFNSVFGLFVVLQVLAAVVGLLGLANTMAISVLERTHELGVLRAFGTRVREIRRMVFVEVLALVGISFAVAIAMSFFLAQNIGTSTGAMLGFDGTPRYPWGLLPILAVVACVAALGAALIPARRASQVDPCVALRLD